MFKQFRKKPVVIEAVKITKENLETFKTDYSFTICGGPDRDPVLSIYTLEGVMFANMGDYIIRGVRGEYYPCKPGIFHETYEAVE